MKYFLLPVVICGLLGLIIGVIFGNIFLCTGIGLLIGAFIGIPGEPLLFR